MSTSTKQIHPKQLNSTSQLDPTSTHIGVEHLAFNPNLWAGRSEPDESERARYWYQFVRDANDKPSTSKITLVGFACDQGVRRNQGRVGAKYGPTAIRQAFAKLPLSSTLQNQLAAENYSDLVQDVGDIVCYDANTLTADVLEQTQLKYSELVTQAILNNSLAIGLGGGHAIAYASYLGLWNALNSTDSNSLSTTHSPKIGIINFDAHLDIRNAEKGTSGTPFKQIAEHNNNHQQLFYYCTIGISQFSNTAALFDRAEKLGVHIISDNECSRLSWADIEQRLNAFIDQVEAIYVTIDMDAFPASIVPGVSAPAAKGIDLDFAERCLQHIFDSGKVKMVDIAEINPTYDIDARSSKVAARLLAQMIEYHLIGK